MDYLDPEVKDITRKRALNTTRLQKQRVYLAGAMDRVPDRGVAWRDSITPFLKELGCVVFNPISKPTEVGLEDQDTHHIKTKLKEMHRYDELSSMMKTIRSVDLRLVDMSDFLVVNLDLETHPCGTLEEIFWANRQKKPIIIHMEQGKHLTPDWLFGTIPHQMIFSTWEELKQYLSHINSSENIDSHKRWYFFNL
jgi:nucleoside 2-deoxyribosyltransferase